MLVKNNFGKEAWLRAFSTSTAKVYGRGYGKFIEFMNKTEEGEWNDKKLLEEREIDLQQRNYAFEQKIVEFHQWLDTLTDKLSDNTRKSYMASACSFFAFHRLDLKFTRQQKTRLYRRAKPARRYYDFILDDLKQMNKVATPKERYVLLVGKSLGLRATDFIQLKQGTFEAHMKGEPPISLGKIYTTKEGVKALPFLDDDATEASKTWLQILEAKGKRDPEARMIDITEQELTLILKKLVKRAQINTGNEIVRFHQLRVFLITRLSKVMETNRLKMIVGKEVPESAYVKPFLLRDDYAKVTEYTTVQEKIAQDEIIKLKDELRIVKERETAARSEVETLKEKMKTIETQLNDLKESIKTLKLKQYYSLSEAFGEAAVHGKKQNAH